MSRRCTLGLCALAFVAIPAFGNSTPAQGHSLKDQLVGTWIYVSSTGKRDDGSTVPRLSLQGAVTYTADGRFHFITTRTDAPKLASSDPSRPTPEEAMAIARAQSPIPAHIRSTKAQRLSTLTPRRALFRILLEPLISAGSSRPSPPTK